MDRIAREGVVFERAYTPAVYTLGAMSSVWTSQYPDRHHGEVSFSARLPKDRLTLAELLTAQGVHTAGFVANTVAGGLNGFERGFAEFHEVWRTLGSGAHVFRQAVPPFLAAARDRPFFAYVHFREPHQPYMPPPPFDTRFGPDAPLAGPIRHDPKAQQSWIVDVNQGRRPITADERAHLSRLYDGNLAYADQEVGALRKALEDAGLWDRTVLIIGADHGEALFEHGWIGHNVQLFEESARVPLVVRFPPALGLQGRRVAGLVDLLDLAPTIADLFGVMGQGGSGREFQGRSLLPVVAGAAGKPAVLTRTIWDRPRYGIFDGRLKLMFDTRTGERALYDLQADPGETRDLARERPIAADYLRQWLLDWVWGGAPGPAAEDARTIPPDECENLKALGYLGADFPCPSPKPGSSPSPPPRP
jgi:arylsulfatase A-like enzyme